MPSYSLWLPTFMPHQTSPVFDRTVLPAALESQDAELLVSFYDMYLSHTREACLDIMHAAPPYNFDRLQRVAHSLKSSSRSVGAMLIGDLLRALEVAAEAGSDERTATCVEAARRVMAETFAAINSEISVLTSCGGQR